MDIRVGLQDAPSKFEGTFLETCCVRLLQSALGRSFPLSALLLNLSERTGAAAVAGSKHEGESANGQRQKQATARLSLRHPKRQRCVFSFGFGGREGPERQAKA